MGSTEQDKGDVIDRVAEVIGTVDRHHDGKGSAAARTLLDSFQRICRAADGMIARDDVWKPGDADGADRFADTVIEATSASGETFRRWRAPGETGDAEASPHPLGAVAEFLVARTIASFGGEKAVHELARWTRDTESRLAAQDRAADPAAGASDGADA